MIWIAVFRSIIQTECFLALCMKLRCYKLENGRTQLEFVRIGCMQRYILLDIDSIKYPDKTKWMLRTNRKQIVYVAELVFM